MAQTLGRTNCRTRAQHVTFPALYPGIGRLRIRFQLKQAIFMSYAHLGRVAWSCNQAMSGSPGTARLSGICVPNGGGTVRGSSQR